MQINPVFKREFLGYFRSPVAYVFLIVFSIAGVGLWFHEGQALDDAPPQRFVATGKALPTAQRVAAPDEQRPG